MRYIKRCIAAIAILLYFSLLNLASAQTTELYIGTGGSVFLTAGESLQVSGLTLTPSSNFDLTKSITRQTTITNAAAGTYIPVVYKFSGTTNSFSGQIKVSYAGSATANESNYKLQYHNGTSWNRDAGSSVDIVNDIVTSSALSSVTLNELTISDMSGTLPLTWLSFTVEKTGGSALLRWATASEQNTRDFLVQHSTDATNWTVLGTVAAAGNSSSTRNYSFTHNNPLKDNIRNYYRILQRDQDGQTSYSRILSLIYDGAGPEFQVYPNPARNLVTVYISVSQELQLINSAGAVVWKGTLPAGNSQISVNNFARGLYVLKAKSGYSQLLIQ